MDTPEGIKFVVMVNKQGHTRFSKWMQHVEDDPTRRRMLEYELVRKCMPRDVDHANFIQHQGYTIVYRRYASLFFIVGIDSSQSPMMVWEFIHRLVEMLNRTFENVSELDIMINSALAHLVLDEALGSGFVMDVNPQSVTSPLTKLPVMATRSSNIKAG